MAFLPFSMRTFVLSGLLSATVAAAVGAAIHLPAVAQKAPAQPRQPILESKPASSDYVDSSVCKNCHAKIAESYSQTGMGRSFSQVVADEAIAGFNGVTVENPPSGMRYSMLKHGGKLFERRWQVGYRREVTNVIEEQVDYVVGSGNHARTFLHRDPQGRLIELPVTWYADGAGYWAMSPGFDRRDQEDFRRTTPAECIFCHDAYPRTLDTFNRAGLDPPAFAQILPEGIDCQRCHGPGRAHVAAVISRASIDQIRGAIVNPLRLDRDRQLEVCMQCHLETSSSHTPNEIRRFNRKIFSYRPGERLGDYKLYFDPLANRNDDRFEIAHAAYRLRMSACFRNSQMTCLTCHDPHVSYRGPGSTERYVAECNGCHAAIKHTTELPETKTCLDCHMPKRRTDDAVHVVMTDHYIQRIRPNRDLLAGRSEAEANPASKAGIALYYPPQLPATEESELYLALAEAKDGSGGKQAIARLQDAVVRSAPTEPEFYYELAHAYAKSGNHTETVHWDEEALHRKPFYPAAAKELAASLLIQGQVARAEQILRRAVAGSPLDAQLSGDLGNVYLREDRIGDSHQILVRALEISPNLAEAENLLGLIAIRKQNRQEAEKWFRAAIRDNPALAEARENLANLLSREHEYEQAAYEYQQILVAHPQDAAAHHGDGLMLELMHSYDQALNELERAVELDPVDADMHSDLADLLAARGQVQQAEEQYRTAIQHSPASADLRASLAGVLIEEGKQADAATQLEKAVQLNPNLYQAHLELSLLLIKAGKTEEARAHSRTAAQSPDPEVRNAATNLLRQLGN